MLLFPADVEWPWLWPGRRLYGDWYWAFCSSCRKCDLCRICTRLLRVGARRSARPRKAEEEEPLVLHCPLLLLAFNQKNGANDNLHGSNVRRTELPLNSRTLKLMQINGIQPLLILVFTLERLLLWHVKFIGTHTYINEPKTDEHWVQTESLLLRPRLHISFIWSVNAAVTLPSLRTCDLISLFVFNRTEC